MDFSHQQDKHKWFSGDHLLSFWVPAEAAGPWLLLTIDPLKASLPMPLTHVLIIAPTSSLVPSPDCGSDTQAAVALSTGDDYPDANFPKVARSFGTRAFARLTQVLPALDTCSSYLGRIF